MRVWAMVLLIAFAVPVVLQPLHQLTDAHEKTADLAIKGASYSKVHEKCAVCDFKFHFFTLGEIIFPPVKAVAISARIPIPEIECHCQGAHKTKRGRAPPGQMFYSVTSIINT